MNSRCKFIHRRSIPRPKFPYRVRNFFGDLTTCSIAFCILYAESLSYFYFRFVRPTDLESTLHASTRTVIISKFEVDMTIHCRDIAFLLLIRYMTLWPFDLEQLSYMAGHVTNPAIKLEDATPIRSWVMSYNVFHWTPLKMRATAHALNHMTRE